MDRFVIELDHPIKSKWDVFILFLVAYSCITSMYSSAFDPKKSQAFIIWDWFVEGFFYIDFILSFFQAYRDTDTLMIVRDFSSVYKNYLVTWFIVDFLAVFPF